MNQDSRQRGQGGNRSKSRRIVSPKRELTEPSAAQDFPAVDEPPPTLEPYDESLTLEQIRALTLKELAAGAVKAAQTLRGTAQSTGKRPRGSTSRDQMARWLVETIFNQVSAGEDGAAGTQMPKRREVPYDELRARREALARAIKSQRNQMNR